MSNLCGRRVVVDVKKDISRHGLIGKRVGRIDKQVDWLVGCPIFVDDETKKSIAVGYECDVVQILEDSE